MKKIYQLSDQDWFEWNDVTEEITRSSEELSQASFDIVRELRKEGEIKRRIYTSNSRIRTRTTVVSIIVFCISVGIQSFFKNVDTYFINTMTILIMLIASFFIDTDKEYK